jgi:hypothetical protein
MLPVAQQGSVLGESTSPTPIFDIADYFTPNDTTRNLLVSNNRFGAALAGLFSDDTDANGCENTSRLPPYNVVLMRGHGMALVGTSIEDAVFRAVNTKLNARMQLNAMLLATIGDGNVKYMTLDELQGSRGAGGLVERTWELWSAQVEAFARGRIYRSRLLPV